MYRNVSFFISILYRLINTKMYSLKAAIFSKYFRMCVFLDIMFRGQI